MIAVFGWLFLNGDSLNSVIFCCDILFGDISLANRLEIHGPFILTIFCQKPDMV